MKLNSVYQIFCEQLTPSKIVFIDGSLTLALLRLLPLLMRMAVWTPHLDLHGAVSRWQALERSGVLRRSGSDGLGIGEKGLEVEVGVVVARLEEENVSKHSPMI